MTWYVLEPLEKIYYQLLLPTALQQQLWLYTSVQIKSSENFSKYFDTALLEREEKKSYPFAYFNTQTQQYVGSTRYSNNDFNNKKAAIRLNLNLSITARRRL